MKPDLKQRIDACISKRAKIDLECIALWRIRTALDKEIKRLGKIYSEQCNMELPLWGEEGKHEEKEQGKEGVQVTP